MYKELKNNAKLKPHGSLWDFLEPRKDKFLQIDFELHPSAKDLIESQGIPHTAIFKLEINGRKEDLGYNLRDGDEISIYPFEDVNKDSLDPLFVRPTCFIVDVHLGKLAKTLRLLGFDARSNKQWKEEALIKMSNQERCMIITRDCELLKNGNTQYGYWVRSTDPDRQIRELFERFSLSKQINPFSRCMKCNGKLRTVSLEDVAERVPPKVKEWHSIFFECANCGQVYWKGSHYEKLKKKVKELTKL